MKTENNFQTWQASSYLSGGNATYLEELYEAYLKDPESVTPPWRNYFQSLPKINGAEASDVSHEDIRNYFANLVKKPSAVVASVSADALTERKQYQVEMLIDAYRYWGHLAAKIDPLGEGRPTVPQLELNYHNLSRADFDFQFRAPDLMGTPTSSLGDIWTTLQNIYCNTIGFEYMYILDQKEVQWLKQRIERNRPNFSVEEKKRILQQLTATDGLERYLGTKYVGQKRFSLEGGDSLIPMLQKIVYQGSQAGLKGIAMGMPHRGRLNVLLNVIGQSPEELFQEFEGRKDYGMTSGDVKYHLGFSSDVKTPHGQIHLSMAFNPSHLEIVSPVIEGTVRAHQDHNHDTARNHFMPLIMHGDAAFAGQGVNMETMNMAQLRGYNVGGSIHIVVNNQVGFTTDVEDARSTLYCTDIAKMMDVPALHVNGDDAEAVVFVAQLALEYRMMFHKDIVIDLVCFRRLGHNEADEPAATQPLMYQKIRQHPTNREIYAQQLIAENVITAEEAQEMVDQYRDALDKGHQIVPIVPGGLAQEYAANWTPYIGQEWNAGVDTAISEDKLNKISKELDKLPKDFELQRQVGLVIAARSKMRKGEVPIDWGYAETLAYASLLTEGYPVRLSGQDSGRGTFAHRHAVLHNQKTGEVYLPLQHLSKTQARFEVYDSLLSEEAVSGFEYGYASTDPTVLTIWELQYGDFANGAQVVIDQFISSGEQKWKRLCGLVVFLPHGYEGAGPEHSSARLERYLQLCAENNMQVCVPTTPAQMFHMLRRQMLRPYRKPLIVMTPKSILRHKLSVSTLEDLTTGKFQLIIPEIDDIKPAKTRRIILCSGKVYYDLLMKRRENNQSDIAIIRIEQLYPFPYDELRTQIDRYTNTKDIVWCQEEPQNQGAWYIIRDRIQECLHKGHSLTYVGRKASAAPAVGYSSLHQKQQAAVVDEALK